MNQDGIRISDEAVRNATGRSWREWEARLDELGADGLSHKEIVALLTARGEVRSGWWAQSVTNGYEKLKGKRIVGQTTSTGFQIGVRRTLSISRERAWALLTSPEGVRAWLGGAGALEFVKGEQYDLPDGTRGEVRVVHPDSHARVTWKPANWSRASTIQIRVEPKGEKAVIGFHEDNLPGSEAREERRAHFRVALDVLAELAEGWSKE